VRDGRESSQSGGCGSGRWSPSPPVKVSIVWSGWSHSLFEKKGTVVSMSERPCSWWPSSGPFSRTSVSGL
jgi:hypothetical protein